MFFTKGGAVVSGVEAKLPGVLSILIGFENLQSWGVQKILPFGLFLSFLVGRWSLRAAHFSSPDIIY